MAEIDLGLIRGSLWYQGTKIVGQSTEGIIFPETGITEAQKGDKYQNSDTNDLYECIVGGAADVAQWVWYGNTTGDISERPVTYEELETIDMSVLPEQNGLLKKLMGWCIKGISSLNSACQTKSITISKPSTTDVFTELNTCDISCRKSGNIVSIRLNVDGTMKSVTEYKTLFIVPEGYRPTQSAIINYITQTGDPMGICIQSGSGSFQLYNNKKDISGWFIRQVITYVI